MPFRIYVRNVEPDVNGDHTNVHIEIFDMQNRRNLPLSFAVKERDSLDHAVEIAIGQLREFVGELYTAVMADNPLGRNGSHR
jgi:hypothetical protein